MVEEDKPFLSRWSKRKQAALTEDAEGEPREDSAPDEQAGGQADGQNEGPPPLTEEEVAALPDPDTLEEGADFKIFMRRGVPETLKRRALRRLWSVNPIYNFRDGLNDYDLDYTDAATVVKNLQSLYQVGKGMVLPEETEDTRAQEEGEAQEEDEAEDEGEAREEGEAGGEGEAGEGAETLAAAAEIGEKPVALETAEAVDDPLPELTPELKKVEREPSSAIPGRAAARRWGI